MIQTYTSVAIGTATTFLAVILLLLRAKFHGRRPALALAIRWVATGARSSGLVLALLSAIATYSFALIPTHENSKPSRASALSSLASSVQSTANVSEERAHADQNLEALRAYADKIDGRPQSETAPSAATELAALPDVETMIAKLVSRLEKQPDDLKGWKMLGWTYLNMDRPAEAARAYETALKLEPSDSEIKKGLEQANSALPVTTRSPASGPATSPTAVDRKAAEGQSDVQRNSMIRGMVDQLATRLETTPNDEDGWLRLMRSRMTLGEKDAAKAALTKALEVFANDAAAKVRLTAAARELGVESN